MWVLTRYPFLVLLGILPLYVIVPVNLFTLLILISEAIIRRGNPEFRAASGKDLWVTVGLLLVAYPLAFGYFWAAYQIMSTSRLTVINNSGRDIQGVVVIDPKRNIKHIGSISTGKKVKYRFIAKGEGSVRLIFQGQPAGQECVALGYVTSGMGQSGIVEISDTLECVGVLDKLFALGEIGDGCRD